MVCTVSFLGRTFTNCSGNVAITKAGITKLAGPSPIDLEKVTSKKVIEDEAILQLLAIPLKESKGASKKKKKQSVKKDEE